MWSIKWFKFKIQHNYNIILKYPYFQKFHFPLERWKRYIFSFFNPSGVLFLLAINRFFKHKVLCYDLNLLNFTHCNRQLAFPHNNNNNGTARISVDRPGAFCSALMCKPANTIRLRLMPQIAFHPRQTLTTPKTTTTTTNEIREKSTTPKHENNWERERENGRRDGRRRFSHTLRSLPENMYKKKPANPKTYIQWVGVVEFRRSEKDRNFQLKRERRWKCVNCAVFGEIC